MPDVANDAWLSELLRHGASADAGVAQELAMTFALRDPSVDSEGLATQALLTALDETWERGWQPADVVHVARSGATSNSVPLVVALIAEHARRSDAASRAPEAWIDRCPSWAPPFRVIPPFALSATASQTERSWAWRRVDDDQNPAPDPRPEVGQSFSSRTDDDGFPTLTIRMPAEAGAALLVALDSLAERDARRERAQNKRAQARHARTRAAGGRIDRAVADRCAAADAVRLARERTDAETGVAVTG